MFLLLDFNTQWCHILLSSDALLKFLNPTPGPSTTSTAAASTSAAQPTSDAASAAQPSHDAAASSGLPAAPIDPADWPSALTEKVRTELVHRGPFVIDSDFTFPKQKDGRRCQHDYFNRLLINGEKVRRTWLMYSKKEDSLHCFCCKMFSKRDYKLSREGLKDWKNASHLLKVHEDSQEHNAHMATWKDLEVRFAKGLTIDKQEMALAEAERKRWREVLHRLVAIIQSLAERNMAFRGSTDTLNKPDNGNFLKEVELMAKFDPVMKQHVSRVESGAGSHIHYLGKTIQNELIDTISSRIIKRIVEDIKTSKYFSIILDCTPDLSHKEQLSVIVRIVSQEGIPQVKEHFLGFLVAEESTGDHLSTLMLKRIEELNIPFEDCRGQSYDNGANMKGKNKGVQARLLQLNSRAFLVPCGAHTLNLVVADAAKSSPDALGYFGHLAKLFKLFSASTHRWGVLLKHVKTTLKSWAETRWESRIKSIEAVRYQARQVREALLEVRETATDPVVRVEAQSLAEEIGSYRFCICTAIWYDILSKIQYVSKLMQSPSMQLDVAVDLLKKTKDSLTSYRNTGFSDAQTTAKEMCEEMNVEAELKQKRLRTTKRHFGYESPDEPIQDALKKMETTFFNVVVDTAISSLDERFQNLGEVNDKFGVLLNFHNLQKEELLQQCQTLSTTLTHDSQPDINGTELAMEMQNFPPLPSKNMTNMELLTFLHEKKLAEIYPNMWVALRIFATLPVTVAAAERSFSKLKLIKTYLRSTMMQERLSGLSIISINHVVSNQLSYDDVVDDFAARKTRRVRL